MIKLTPRVAKLIGSDNQPESGVNALKSPLKRTNKYGRSTAEKAHVDARAAAYCHRALGFEQLVYAVRSFREHRAGVVAPREAASNLKWLQVALQ